MNTRQILRSLARHVICIVDLLLLFIIRYDVCMCCLVLPHTKYSYHTLVSPASIYEQLRRFI